MPAPTPTPAPVPEPQREIDASVEPPPVDASVVARPPRRDAAVDATTDPEIDTREPLLIDRARVALRRGLVDEALATLMRHKRIHPRGALTEERDVLVVEAYAAKGEVELAKRRIERYRRDRAASCDRGSTSSNTCADPANTVTLWITPWRATTKPWVRDVDR